MKVGGSRNFGFGKNMVWAASNVLKERYGGGHFGTVATHAERFKKFADFCRAIGVKEARQINREILQGYAKMLGELVNNDEMRVSTAQNLLSTVNTVMRAFRQDQQVWISPSQMVGKRSTIRATIPQYCEREQVTILKNSLRQRGEERVAAMVVLARELGVRFKEAILINAKIGLSEAMRHGSITVVTGTKGGRPRELSITNERQIEALRDAVAAQMGSPNMIIEGSNYVEYRDHVYYEFYRAGGSHFHDLRAAYACDRYRQITGYPAPVLRLTGDAKPDRDADNAARKIIARELGHNRVDVVSEYIGGRR